MNTYSQEILDGVHQVELSILGEIERVCKQNNIEYFAYAGTLLGAVRHKGFIPWDDDIDIGMMREDYNRFLEVAPKELSNQFSIEHATINLNFPVYYAKVFKNGTLFVETHTKKSKVNQGIFVDVFPFDNAASSECARKLYKKRIEFYNQLNRAKVLSKASSVKPPLKRIIAVLGRSILKVVLLPIPRSFLFNRMDEVVQMYNKSDSTWVSSRGYAVVRKNDLLPIKQLQFENIRIPVPQNADAMLRNIYGDYMTLPPAEKRVGHAPDIIRY